MLLETGIGLGLQGLSSALGFRSDRKQAKLQQQSMRQAQAQFDAQMDTSVQRRVRDAKAAGIHPLFAMGASVGASPTMSSGNAPVGRGGERGVAALAESLGLIGANKAQAARDEAEAALANAQAAQIRQDMLSQGRDLPAQEVSGVRPGFTAGPMGPPSPKGPPAALYETDIGRRQDPAGVGAATQPALQKVTLPGGREIWVPDAQMFEEPWSPATLGAIGAAVLGATDQEIWKIVKRIGSHFSKNFRPLGLTDQQIFDKLKRASRYVRKRKPKINPLGMF